MTTMDGAFPPRPHASTANVVVSETTSKLNGLQIDRPWDEQIYCVPSEEQKFNRLIRDPASGK